MNYAPVVPSLRGRFFNGIIKTISTRAYVNDIYSKRRGSRIRHIHIRTTTLRPISTNDTGARWPIT